MGCSSSTEETIEQGLLVHGYGDTELEVLLTTLNAILDEPEQTLTTITLTKAAAEKYREILKDEGKEGWGLRLGGKSAGCSGFEYILDYSEKAQPEDTVFESEGIHIHVQEKLLSKLLGCTIDYVSESKGTGFSPSSVALIGEVG